MNASGMLALTGQRLSGYFGVGPKYATVATRSGWWTTTTSQEAPWTDTRSKQLMPPILVSWTLDWSTWVSPCHLVVGHAGDSQ